MQKSNAFKVIQIPFLHQSPLCPVTAIKCMLAMVKASSDSPLFLLPKPLGNAILTAPILTSTLSTIICHLKLNPANFGFHALEGWPSPGQWTMTFLYRICKLMEGGHLQLSTLI